MGKVEPREVVIAVGSNIEPEENVARAREILTEEHIWKGQSRFVWTKPIGLTDQPDFYNGAFLVATSVDRESFRTYLKEIEDRLGRDRTAPKYGPRTIDLDIAVWDGEIVDNDYYKRFFLRQAVDELFRQRG